MTDDNAIKTCAKCGAENPPEARFCGSCGSLLTSELDREPGPVENLGTAWPAEEYEESRVSAPAPAEPEEAPPQVDLNMPGAGLAPGKPVPPPPQQPAPPSPQAPGAGAGSDADPHGTVDEAYTPGGTAGLRPEPGGARPAAPPPPPSTDVSRPNPLGGEYQVPPPGYGYSMPADGNTTGMGEGYPAPEYARGWTFAGFVPYGLYAFINGSPVWGVVGLVGSFISIVGLVYLIYIGIEGRQLAWRNRRFDSVQQYMDTMRVWNSWGLGMLFVSVGLTLIILIFFFYVFGVVLTESY